MATRSTVALRKERHPYSDVRSPREGRLTQSQKHSALAWLFREVISRCQTIIATVTVALLLCVFLFPNSFSFSASVSAGGLTPLQEKVDGQSPSGVIIPITP